MPTRDEQCLPEMKNRRRPMSGYRSTRPWDDISWVLGGTQARVQHMGMTARGGLRVYSTAVLVVPWPVC